MMDTSEFKRWFDQAIHTYDSARRDYESSDFDWACFKCQQVAEFALKALLRGAGKLGIGYSLLRLTEEIKTLGINIDEIRKCSLSLERYYIPTRYPDAYPEGSPYEFYDAEEAEKALDCCLKIIEFVKEGFHGKTTSNEKERENLLEKAEKYLKKLGEKLGPLSGIAFGSVSRGDFNDASDIDVLVIADGLPKHPLRKLEILLDPCIPGIDPKGYTRSEFEKLKKKGNPFVQLVVKEGIVLKMKWVF